MEFGFGLGDHVKLGRNKSAHSILKKSEKSITQGSDYFQADLLEIHFSLRHIILCWYDSLSCTWLRLKCQQLTNIYMLYKFLCYFVEIIMKAISQLGVKHQTRHAI